jgi:hypothetical protein
MDEKFNTLNYFNLQYKRINESIRHQALSSITFEMAGKVKNSKNRVANVLERSRLIFSDILAGKDFWIRLCTWDGVTNTLNKLSKVGFKIDKAGAFYEQNEDCELEDNEDENCEIVYLYYNSFNFEDIYPLILVIASFDLGLEPHIDIKAFFICFHPSHILINLYDDRGMEVIASKNDIKKSVKKFSQFLLT